MTKALTAFYARAAASEALRDLLGLEDETQAIRLSPGWPAAALDKPEEANFPRASYMRVTRSNSSAQASVDAIEVQVDVFVWVDGPRGGLGRLDAIEAEFEALFESASWVDKGTQMRTSLGVSRDFYGDPENPHRRSIPVLIDAAAA